MKHFFKIMGMAAIAAVTSISLLSCSEESNSLPKSYNMLINLNLGEGLTFENLSDVKVLMTNKKGEEQTIDMTTMQKTVEMPQGQYDMTLSGKVLDESAAYVVGKNNVELFADATVTINVEKILKSTIVFKSIYTTGGKQGYMVDSYFELVNNSDEVQYLDRLIITSPTVSKLPNPWQSNGITDKYACGQGSVIAFPGSGKDYPLQPGESIVLANNAANHTDLAGDGNHCPDLSKADWEIVLPKVASEIDYPAQNVEVIFQNNTYMKAFGLGFFGRGYALARCPGNMTPAEFAANKDNIMTTPGNTSKMEYLMVPSKYVLDAVEIWDGNETEHNSTFLPKDDAQGVFASKAWSGKCIRRKVTEIKNGRVYYQDTNNSSNDFVNEQPLTPGQTPAQVD